MSVYERLALVRRDTGLTQTQFAEELKVSRRAYINYESGERELPLSLVLTLHQKLSILPTWFLTGEGAKTLDLKTKMISGAVSAVNSFAKDKNLEFSPKDRAKLVVLLVEYFEQVGKVDIEFADKMLELQA